MRLKIRGGASYNAGTAEKKYRLPPDRPPQLFDTDWWLGICVDIGGRLLIAFAILVGISAMLLFLTPWFLSP